MGALRRELDAIVAFKEEAEPIGCYFGAHYALMELKTTNLHEPRAVSVGMPEYPARAAARFAEVLGGR